MTTELQTAMARYEEARGSYQRAVLASLNGMSNGDAIRRAIQEFQAANAELRKVMPARAPAPAAVTAPRRAPAPKQDKRAEERPSPTPLDFVWRLLRAS
jgi:hypothetical protein